LPPSSFAAYPTFHLAKMLGSHLGNLPIQFTHQRKLTSHGFPVEQFVNAMAIDTADR
jgi:hypothetical protein